MRFKKQKRDKFEDLDTDFKDSIQNSSDEQIKARIAEISLNELENRRLKKADKALKEAVEAAKDAGEKYKNASALHGLTIQHTRSMTEGNLSDDAKQKIAECALNEVENQKAKKDDQELAEKVAQAKMAAEGYAEASKMNKLRIAYAYMMLDSRGKI